ncbi:MAG: CRISPR-associated endonuclease Cas2 [Candidatus Aminicenantes bacterium]|nr:CRISPR-associated endonuclease Cas2 [Candidatus Aminicenantes bacterium]
MLYIVAYDIPDDRRRYRIAQTLLDFGKRVQHSVFECILDEKLVEEMQKRLSEIISIKEDSVRIYSLCGECKDKIFILGQGEMTIDEDVYIL